MKVLIVGSKRHFEPAETAQRETFEQACRQMGRALAERGHTLIVGTPDAEDADRFFVEGANEVPGPHKVMVFRPESDPRPTPFAAELEKLKNIQFTHRQEKGPWAVVHAHALREADVLIVLGGRTATQVAGGSAAALQKPVLALRCFGGGGKEVWEEVQHYYTEGGISKDDQGALKQDWTRDSAQLVVKCVESLVKYNPLRPKSHGPQVVMSVASFILIALWAVLLTKHGTLGNNAAFYLMLAISALLGTSLRNTIRLVQDDSAVLSGRALMIEATAGVLIAFGFALLYLAGGIVLIGDVISLTADTAFMRVAISMSILGFAAAFLLNEAADILKTRMGESLKRNSSGR